METLKQVKQKEIEITKDYSIREHKANIIFYTVFQFLYSDLFTVIFIFIPLFFIAKYYHFNGKVVFALLIVHAFVFSFNKPLNKRLGLDDIKEEFNALIKVNKELMQNKINEQNQK
jgi:hypothetical protein